MAVQQILWRCFEIALQKPEGIVPDKLQMIIVPDKLHAAEMPSPGNKRPVSWPGMPNQGDSRRDRVGPIEVARKTPAAHNFVGVETTLHIQDGIVPDKLQVGIVTSKLRAAYEL